MRVGTMERRRKRPALSATRRHGIRRTGLRKRWTSEGAYIFSNPANVRWIAEARAQLDYWRELTGTPPFDPSYADGEVP